MPATKEVGRLFAHLFEYPPGKSFPLVDKGSSQEIEYPFRSGTSLVVRAPFSRKCLVVGVWGDPAHDADDALGRALRLGKAQDVSS